MLAFWQRLERLKDILKFIFEGELKMSFPVFLSSSILTKLHFPFHGTAPVALELCLEMGFAKPKKILKDV